MFSPLRQTFRKACVRLIQYKSNVRIIQHSHEPTTVDLVSKS